MAQEVLEKEIVTTDQGDHDRFAHFFDRADIDAAWLEGKEITALCGKKDRPVRELKDYPVCPTCTEIHKELPK
ncbi:DUF3039 domain-containing protein [Agromyces sp. NPDC057679]|uniref:DUF3039 domain-containing protein n=1 Tax=Agromyces sp. NPDC057679 TaxID=3346207 RepID=UPI00366C1685